jgi:hypothetical protein
VSHLLVQSTLQSVLAQHNATPASFKREELSGVVEQAMIGMRLFCDPERLPELMVALAEYCEPPSHLDR